ncbi:hypothetical protein ACFFGH_12790 [Lysobacter korlensis]|uniref:YhfC family intramembrane metalloprotease n=1 Tax=Lysobacter korlensis TaxID=553636 RepID=A0ABV6RS21_9GAMM
MTTIAPEDFATKTRINAFALLPAPILVGIVMAVVSGPFELLPFVLGAAGWMIALVLRQPVALIAMRAGGQERAATIVGWFSGPAEELVRFGLVILILGNVQGALWAGFGWAAIEVVLIAVNGFAIAGLMTKDDPKSREAREILAAQGMMTGHHPLWGFLERLSAIALHIGFTLMIFANPWLVLITLPLHSVVNMAAARFAKSHVALTELGLAVVGAAVLLAGLLLSGG